MSCYIARHCFTTAAFMIGAGMAHGRRAHVRRGPAATALVSGGMDVLTVILVDTYFAFVK